MASPLSKQWSEWSAQEWNSILFRYFFSGDSSPISRLVVTSEELRKITGDDSADPEKVRQAFVAAVRRPPDDIHRLFSTFWLNRGREWTSSDPPAFTVYLLFTCFVASGTEELLNEGDFRRRMCRLLEHPLGTSYPLDQLPRLWEALAEWLKRNRAAGAPYRELKLPDPGRMTRIGYSIKLAFPLQRDQLRLVRLLAPHGFSEKPPVREVLELLQRHLSGFSPRFQDEYEQFLSAYSQGEQRLAEYPFWSAVCEAVSARTSAVRASDAGVFQLILDTDSEGREEMFLMTSAPLVQAGPDLGYVEAEASVGDYCYIVFVNGTTDGFDYAVKLLLENVLDRVLPRTRNTPLGIAVRQGVLLFQQNEWGVRELATTRPQDGEVWAVVREDLVEPFVSCFPEDKRPKTYLTRYPSWVAVQRFESDLLPHFNAVSRGLLAGVRCLQQTATTVSIALTGGVPLGGAYLGIKSCLPIVRIAEADEVVLNAVIPFGDRLIMKEVTRLHPKGDESGTFVFPERSGADLEGRFTLTAKVAGVVIAQRQLAFRAEMLWHGFARPTDPDSWLVESIGPDVVTAQGNDNSAEIAENEFDGSKPRRSSTRRPKPERVLSPAAGRLTSAKPSTSAYTRHLSDEQRVDRFVECCAGWASQRKGLTESELLDWIRASFDIEENGLVFDIARAWTEGGYFDCLMRRRWRGRVYFARDPELVVWRSGAEYCGVLRGLASRAVRNRVNRSAERHDARRRIISTGCAWLPEHWRWTADSWGTFARMATECDLKEVRWLKPIQTFLEPLATVTAAAVDEPAGYVLRGVWNWDHGRFAPKSPTGSHKVEVRWLWRSNSPAYYQVLDDGIHCWSSPSRNWALLLAYALADVAPFAKVGTTGLVRNVRAQVYLPVQVGRFLACASDTPPGPCLASEGTWSYGYTFPTESERDSLIKGFWPSDRREIDQVRREIRWVLSVANGLQRRGQLRVPIPLQLRRVLAETTELPEATELSRLRVDAFLIPHIKRLADRLKTS